MKAVFRLTFHFFVGLMVLGAIIGLAVAVSNFNGVTFKWDDTVIEGTTSWVVGALVGAVVGMCVAVTLALVATLVGVIVPLIIAAVLAAVGIAVIIALAGVLGSVALALSPVLLLGFGCVLLARAITRRSKASEPLPHIS
jgi:hypothetical protein